LVIRPARLTIRLAIFGGMSLSFRRDAFRLPHGPAAGPPGERTSREGGARQGSHV